MAEFVNSIMRKCKQNKMRALQYLEHCIHCCYDNNDIEVISHCWVGRREEYTHHCLDCDCRYVTGISS